MSRNLSRFTDIDAAIEEAQFIADEERADGQRHAAYLVQRTDGLIGVNAWRPHGTGASRIMMTVHPVITQRLDYDKCVVKKIEPNYCVGVHWQPYRRRHRVSFCHHGNRNYGGVYKNWFDAVCARKSLENRFL